VTIIDAHAHLDERMLQVPAMLRLMDQRGVDRVVLIPCMNDPLPHTPKALLWVVRRLLCSPLHGIARAISDRTLDPQGDLRLSGKTYRIYSRPDNATVAAVLAAHPQRFLGWIFLNPRLSDHLEELERWRIIPGFVGVKLHSHWHDWPIEDALPIARRCEQLKLPILPVPRCAWCLPMPEFLIFSGCGTIFARIRVCFSMCQALTSMNP
jgi:uncharacterized protein